MALVRLAVAALLAALLPPALASTLRLELLPNTTANGAVCLDGSPAGTQTSS